jgi:hypothetical protein
VSKIFVLADSILGATTIRQVTNGDHRTNQEHRKAMNSGGNTVSQVSGKMAGEITSITTGDLAAVVALNSSAFCNSGLALLGSTITIAYKVRANGGSFASGSNHVAVTGSNALIVPTQFEATQDGDFATCQMDAHWISTDGLTKGADDATGQALGGQSFNAEFALGPAYINGTLIAGVQSVRINPGIEVTKPPLGSGSVFPTNASIKTVTPTIEITVNDFDAIAGTVGDWTAMTSANIYFRRRADSGVYSSSSDNIRFTFAAGLTDTNSVSVSNQDDGSATITLHGKTLTANAAVAIP